MLRRWKRPFAVVAALACALALFLAVPAEASAYGTLDVSKTGSVSLRYSPDHGDPDGIRFRLYQVGTVSNDAELALTEAWKDYPVSFSGLDVDGWAELANTLSGYAAKDSGKLRAEYEARTDESGEIKWDDVKAGVYLLMGDSHEARELHRDGSTTVYHYEPRPEMVILPYLDAKSGWVYARDIGMVKFDVTNTTEKNTVDRRVIKVWDDRGHTNERPSSVEVALLKGDVVHEVVTLNASNAWRHDWENLDANATWRVVELTRPLNYRVSVGRSGNTFILTNTYVEDDQPYIPPYVPPTTPPDVPEPPEKPGVPDITVIVPEDVPEEDVPLTPWVIVADPGDPEEPEDIPNEDVPTTVPRVPEDLPDPDVPLEDLPQTGQLWWPVPLLAGLAVLIFGLGVTLLRKKDD